MAIFVKELKGLLPSLNRIGEVDKTKAKKFFDWKLVTTEESVIESAKKLKRNGLNGIKKMEQRIFEPFGKVSSLTLGGGGLGKGLGLKNSRRSYRNPFN
ncbi:MAG: hypothetical protein Ct9H90mP4_09660 [Gammaproteobacteria bacterium]|nr:MAG: hypothetical protein Ct9H90mP4_09660 [Gammaproteobacteria bacterium]